MHEKEAEFLPFAFGEVEHESGRIPGGGHGRLVDRDDEFLADQEADEVLLHRVDGAGEPDDAEFIEKGKNHFEHGFLEARLADIGRDDAVEFTFVHFHHGKGEGIELGVGIEVYFGQGRHFFDDFVIAHPGDLGNLDSVLVEQGDIQDAFEVIILIIPDIGRRSLGLDDTIALLPYPEGMGFDSRKFFQVANGIDCHVVDYLMRQVAEQQGRIKVYEKCKIPDEFGG